MRSQNRTDTVNCILIFFALIVDEVNANNEDIEQQSISFKSEIEDFFERVNKVFGYKVDVYDMNEMFKEAEDEVDEKEDGKDESSFEN